MWRFTPATLMNTKANLGARRIRRVAWPLHPHKRQLALVLALCPQLITQALWSPLQVGCIAQLAERRSLAGELTLSCAWPVADGWPLCG